MNAPARTTQATLILRNASGEPPLGIGGLAFRDDQGWMYWPHDQAYQMPATRIGLLELENGEWLAHPPGFLVEGLRFKTRDAALRTAIARVIRKARRFMRAKDGEGTSWSEGFAGRVIEWALSIKPEAGIPASEEINLGELTIAGYEASDAGASLSDPVVRYLVEQHSLRKQFPAKHNFSMTTEVFEGRIVSVATCTCNKVTFKFGSNDYLRMNAAIEAHWRRFSHEKTIDGRGQPTGADARVEPGHDAKPKKSRRKSQPGAGGLTSAPYLAEGASSPPLRESEPAPDAMPPDGAGSTISALRAIAAGEHLDWPIVRGLVGDGLAHATTTRLSLTEAGEALLREIPFQKVYALIDRDGKVQHTVVRPEPAPIGAGSVADVKCQACEPASTESLGDGDTVGRTGDAVADAVNGTTNAKCESVTGGESAAPLSDDDDLAIEWPSYDAFLEDKIVTAPLRGIEVARDALHPWLKDFNKDLLVWSLRLGCSAIFAAFGLHKTAMQLEWAKQLGKHTGGPTLNVLPLGCRHGFINEAEQKLDMAVSFINDAAALGINARYIERPDQMVAGCEHYLTNYEPIRDGKLDPNLFAATSLDEASVLRSYGSKTFQEFLPLFAKVPFKLVATATPSPNRYKELIHYAGFLGVMDTGLALTRWFQRNSEKAGDLTLYPHKEDEFWMWVHSWAAFIQRPSDLGYSDEGYELPPLKINWCEVPADHSKAEPERDGQSVMFRNVANGLQQAAKSRKDSLPTRIAKMSEIIAQDPEPHRIIWHDLEAEREAVEAALPEVVTIMGSMHIDDREIRLRDFEEGRIKYFATKPILSGSGSNFQYHCHKAIYVGMPGDGYKFNDFIQSIYRLQRFGQTFPVEVDIIYSEDMRAGRAALEQKWALDTEMRKRMSEIIKKHGLNTLPLRDALARTIGVKRVEIRGQNFIAINNDCVTECRTWPDNSVDQIITSIPFSNHYEYSASYRDFGHTDDNGHFWGQMDFLTCELLRMLKPGRLACIHVKDRVLFGSVTGEGVPTISPFHAEAIMHYRAHGFQYMGMIHINTDVVRENASGSYRLGWSENCKDSTKMGCGAPEYVILLRKRQSDRTRGYADAPVTKDKWNGEGAETPNDGYSRARWQIDAHAMWRSSGNRLLTAEEFAGLEPEDLVKIFARISTERVYDYEAHVKIGENLERIGRLPAEWMACPPGATEHHTWHDVNRMRTLNMMQVQKGREKHICPLQFDIVDRLIERFSNEGDLILDPFGGIGTVNYRALLKGRRGASIELSATYFLDNVYYSRMAEEKMETPQLFDLATFDAVNTPPPRT